MQIPLFKNLLSILLASILWNPLLIAQATETPEVLSVTLDKTVEFTGTEGESILLPPGTYSVESGDEQLALQGSEATPIIIEATQATHTFEIPFPMIVSTSGDDAGLPDSQLLVFLNPDGHSLQAVGTYPQITSRGLVNSTATNLEEIDPALISLENPVYLNGPDGSPVVVEPGTYTAEVASPWIRLIPGKERQNALLIEAQQGTHDTGTTDLLALSLPGGYTHDVDLHQILLLLPNGESLEADGTYSGIQTRGLFSKKSRAQKAKKRAQKAKKRKAFFKRVGTGIKKTSKSVGKVGKAVGGGITKGAKNPKWALGQVGKGAATAAKATWKGIKYVGKKGPVWTCKALFKAPQGLAKIVGGPIKLVTGQVKKLIKKPKFVNNVTSKVNEFQKKQRNLINNAIKSSLSYNKPKFLNSLKPFATIDGMCENGIGALNAKLKAITKPRGQVRSRGVTFPTTSFGIQGAGTFKIGGLEGGAGSAWTSQSKKGYWFVGGTAQLPQLSGKVLLQFGKWRSLDNLKGGYVAAGFTAPIFQWAKVLGWVPGEQGVPPYKGGGGAELNITVDFFLSLKPLSVVGIVVSPGVSAGLANSFAGAGPLGRITIQAGGGGHFKG